MFIVAGKGRQFDGQYVYARRKEGEVNVNSHLFILFVLDARDGGNGMTNSFQLFCVCL